MRTDLEHKQQAPAAIRCFVLTVSDTRTEATDKSGQAIVALLEAAGFHIAGRCIVRDDGAVVRRTVERQLARHDVDAIVTTGGTGITSRDNTFEAVTSLIEKAIEGFGEIFRALSYAEIGAAAMMSRATAGVVAGRIIVALPGSEAAVRLAVTKLVIPELGHMVQQARK